jgi:hypothetical protein
MKADLVLPEKQAFFVNEPHYPQSTTRNGYHSTMTSPLYKSISIFDDDSTVMTVLTSALSAFEDLSLADPASPSAVQKSRKSCKLRFDLESNKVFPIQHLDDMAETEIQSIWYEQREYEAIRNNILPILRKMRIGENPEESNFTSVRGLEYRTREGALVRRRNKSAGVTAVLRQQAARRRICAPVDPERISKVYRRVTVAGQARAHAFALADEAFIQKDSAEMSRPRCLPLVLLASKSRMVV